MMCTVLIPDGHVSQAEPLLFGLLLLLLYDHSLSKFQVMAAIAQE